MMTDEKKIESIRKAINDARTPHEIDVVGVVVNHLADDQRDALLRRAVSAKLADAARRVESGDEIDVFNAVSHASQSLLERGIAQAFADEMSVSHGIDARYRTRGRGVRMLMGQFLECTNVRDKQYR